ncbi:hypothetical protein HMPREF0972_01820 [Actinomyces sp. oral taxon 848 str. F0332]|nr:hypothetical protein HMPREF0972_01820 [Actinomyces sp. oral taxon 848 str. F0332]
MLHGGNIAGWTWDLQAQAMPERRILTPTFPDTEEGRTKPDRE